MHAATRQNIQTCSVSQSSRQLGRHCFLPISTSACSSSRRINYLSSIHASVIISSESGRRAASIIGCCSSVASGSTGVAVELPASCMASCFQPTTSLIATIVQFVLMVTARTREIVSNAFPKLADIKGEDVRRQLKQLSVNARLLAFIAPFAKAAASDSLTAVYTRTFERAAFGFAKMYLFCLFMRVLLSWFPSIDWNAQPWTFLRLITEPYLQIYRGILPPLFGQLDFTPLFGFLILQDVVEVMAPTYTMGMHFHDTSTKWTTSDVMCYFDGF